MKNRVLYFLVSSVAFVYSCGEPHTRQTEDTATSGTITIAADESLRPIVEAEVEVFEGIYKDAKLNVIYTNEYDAIGLVTSDSARIAIVTRDLLPAEKAAFDQDRITPRYSPFAYDAIAVILNKENKDTVFAIEQIAKLLDGTYKTWKDVNPRSAATPIQVVFDNPKSGIIRYLKDSLLNGREMAKHCFAVENNPAVIEHVEKNKNCIGLIGVSWISDQDDSVMHSFVNKIRVASLVPANVETAESRTMKPYQAYIGLKQYPLWRKVQIISREPRVGLGTGFASFVASDRGQRIVLKSGLVPSLAPIRILQINNQPIQ